MGSDMDKELEEEIIELEDEAEEKEREADEKLDQLLPKKKMEFCPRCGRKVGSHEEWGGRCLHDGCSELVCLECWSSEEKRFCRQHEKDFVKKEETTEDDVKNVTLNYMEFVEQRLKKSHLDWSPDGFIRKTKTKVRDKKYRQFEVMVYEKHFFSKKPKIRILVRPASDTAADEVNGFLETPLEGVYDVVVFVGNAASLSQKIIRFAEGFSNKRLSLFAFNTENGSAHFNAREKITEKYACWFDPAKTPLRFSDLLKTVAETVSDSRVVAVKDFAEALDIGKDEAARILKTSKLLEEVRGAETFILKA